MKLFEKKNIKKENNKIHKSIEIILKMLVIFIYLPHSFRRKVNIDNPSSHHSNKWRKKMRHSINFISLFYFANDYQ